MFTSYTAFRYVPFLVNVVIHEVQYLEKLVNYIAPILCLITLFFFNVLLNFFLFSTFIENVDF